MSKNDGAKIPKSLNEAIRAWAVYQFEECNRKIQLLDDEIRELNKVRRKMWDLVGEIEKELKAERPSGKLKCPKCGSEKVFETEDEDSWYSICQECGYTFAHSIKPGFG